jgi:ABC-type glycerol-3-phosphate transport system substrate-binding protein
VTYFSFQNRLYALPRDLEPVCLVYYNKALFDAARMAYPEGDWDWKKFLQTAGVLSAPENPQNKKRVWGFVEDWPMVEPWVYGEGGRWVDDGLEPQKYAVTAKGFLEGIRFRCDLIRKYKITPSPQDFVAEGQIGGSDLFLQGQAAMFLSGPWKGVEFNEHTDLKWGVEALPRAPRGFWPFQVGGSGWGLMTSSANPKQAGDLLRFLSGTEAQERYAQSGLALPALAEVEKKMGGFKNPAQTEAALDLVIGFGGIMDPRACNWPDIRENHINPILERVWSGELSPEKAVDLIQKDLAGIPPSMKPPERKPPAQNKPAMFLF